MTIQAYVRRDGSEYANVRLIGHGNFVVDSGPDVGLMLLCAMSDADIQFDPDTFTFGHNDKTKEYTIRLTN
jgi:hypothetical protein